MTWLIRNFFVSPFVLGCVLASHLVGCSLSSSVQRGDSGSTIPSEKQVSVSIPAIELTEGQSLLVVFNLSKTMKDDVNLNWTLTGTDVSSSFSAVSGSATIAADTSNGSFTISSLNDHIYTGGKNFLLQVSLGTTDFILTNTDFNVHLLDAQMPVLVGIDTPAVVTGGNVASYVLSGTCSENGENVRVEVRDGTNTVTVPAAVCASGVWTTSAVNLTGLNEGNVVIVASHSSAGGDNATPANSTVLKDTTPPGNPSAILDGVSLASLTSSPTVTFVGVSASDLSHYEIQVLALSDNTIMKDWATFVSGNAVTGLSLTSEQSYYVKVRSVDTRGNASSGASSDGWLADATGPSAPTGLAFEFKSMKLNSTGPIQMTSVGSDISGVLKTQLRLVDGSDAVVVDWFDNGVNTTYKNGSWSGFTGLSLTGGATYKVQARSIDNLNNLGSIAELSFTANNCPTNYVPVYPLASRPAGNYPTYPYPTQTFCVAKFEMKAVDGSGNLVNSGNGNVNWNAAHLPSSRPDGTPWAKQITQVRASQKCQEIGQALVTNGQWQTMARHIASTDSNWSTGVAYSTFLSIGNYGPISSTAVTDGLAFGSIKALAASSATIPFDDNNGYVGILTPTKFEGLRTHNFPWGDKIWDLGGNVAELVRDIGAANNYVINPSGNSGDAQHSTLLGPALIDMFGFSQNYSACTFSASGTWMQDQNFCHMGEVILPKSSDNWDQAIARGSHYSNGSDNGIFKVDGMDGTTDNVAYYGFRCVIENP